jgi:hypothetical protein
LEIPSARIETLQAKGCWPNENSLTMRLASYQVPSVYRPTGVLNLSFAFCLAVYEGTSYPETFGG